MNVRLGNGKDTDAEILVCVDSDSHLGEGAIWEIVQPFADPNIAAVSGSVLVRNPFVNLLTWIQALEYYRCIFLGRMFTSRLGILGIVSGAFGAYRREAILQVGAWDVGPGDAASFPTKWISPDGKNLSLVFSGNDAFSVRKATLITGAIPKTDNSAIPSEPTNITVE